MLSFICMFTCWMCSSRSSCFCPVSFMGNVVCGRSTVSRYSPPGADPSDGRVLPPSELTPWRRLLLKETAGWSRPPTPCDPRPHPANARLTAGTRRSSSMEKRRSAAATTETVKRTKTHTDVCRFSMLQYGGVAPFSSALWEHRVSTGRYFTTDNYGHPAGPNFVPFHATINKWDQM